MKVAIFGTGISWAILDELVEIVDIIKKTDWNWSVPTALLIEDNLVEPTPYVGCYQSASVAKILWAVALKQFYHRCTYHA